MAQIINTKFILCCMELRNILQVVAIKQGESFLSQGLPPVSHRLNPSHLFTSSGSSKGNNEGNKNHTLRSAGMTISKSVKEVGSKAERRISVVS